MTLTTRTRWPERVSIEVRAPPGRAGRKVHRAQQPRLALDEDERLALVPGMVAEGDGIGAGGQELVADRLGDAEAAGGVLAVDDDAIEPPALAQGRAGARSPRCGRAARRYRRGREDAWISP